MQSRTASSGGESVELLPPSSEGSSTSPSSSKVDLERRDIGGVLESTNWKAIYIVSTIQLLTFIINYTLNVSNYVYLQKLDPSASAEEQGNSKALYRLVVGSSSGLLSVLAYQTKKFRPIVLFGAATLIASCLLYTSIECFSPPAASWVWMIVFATQPIAEGANVVLVSYIPRVSTEKDRLRAYGILGLAEVLGVFVSPIIQVTISSFLKDEHSVFGISWLKLSEFTLPIWICLGISIINILFIYFCMREPPMETHQKSFMSTMKQAWREIKRTDRVVLGVAAGGKMIASIGCTTILTLASPYLVATANMDAHDQQWLSTVFQLDSGVTALVTVVCAVAIPFLARIKASKVFLVALGLFTLAYGLAIPTLPFLTQGVITADELNPFGCNVTKLAWCHEYSTVPNGLFIYGTSTLIGIAFPLCNIAHDTIFSQILGNIDQNILQGCLITSINLVSIVVPLTATSVFNNSGPNAWWTFVTALMAFGFIIWACTMKRLHAYTSEVKERDARKALESSSQEDLNYRHSLTTDKDHFNKIPL